MTAKEVYEKTKNLSLLLVEDDIDVRDKTSSMLQDLFKNVETAVDGLEAYELYLSNKNRDYFDIVVTDINMPRLDGLSMVEKILDINPNQEIIVISAYGDYEKLQKIIQMGATSYIEKPLQIDELLNKLYMVASKIETKQKNKEQELKAMEFDEIVIQKSECQMLLWAALRKSDFLLLTNNYRTFLETIYNKIENQEFIEIENNQSSYE
ncbi:MAG: response regulator, partial [Arcobacter butzleri]|nr:response regulator [Aliarcobacter butzleri]